MRVRVSANVQVHHPDPLTFEIDESRLEQFLLAIGREASSGVVAKLDLHVSILVDGRAVNVAQHEAISPIGGSKIPVAVTFTDVQVDS